MARAVRIASPVVLPKQTDKIQPKSEPNLDGFYFFHDPNLEKSIFKSQEISHRKALQTRYKAEDMQARHSHNSLILKA